MCRSFKSAASVIDKFKFIPGQPQYIIIRKLGRALKLFPIQESAEGGAIARCDPLAKRLCTYRPQSIDPSVSRMRLSIILCACYALSMRF